MEKFFIVLIVVIVILILLVIFGGKKNPLTRKIFEFFVEEAEGEDDGRPHTKERRAAKQAASRKNANQPYTEMAILMQKIDERRRVVDSSGHSTLYDEYFELVFETRKGETLHLTASRAAFKEVPFNQQGSLTHKKGQLVKFKYIGGLISDEYSPMQS
ncbi:MAG: hypothetical protein IJN11_02670 [Oscillospiraceae bacterium]|nr:hypothetical protein [Ruminococcus sp.]MBQ7004174.1 hypothetical protein [Oscillospiraceae bacterium]MBQ7012804.1 hypothetical protein [Oscillospiraceae bacterium]